MATLRETRQERTSASAGSGAPSLKYRSISLAVAGALLDRVSRGVARLPSAWRYLPADAITIPLARLLAPKRRIITANYATMLGVNASDPLPRWLAAQSIVNYGRMAIDFLASRTMSPEDALALTTARGVEHLRDALSDGKGVIFTLPHFGSWDMAAVLATAFGCKLTVVTESDWLTELVAGSRKNAGITLAPRDRSLRLLFRALARQECVVMLTDVINEGVQSIAVPFFGHPAPFPIGPARLSEHTGAPIMVVSAWRASDHTYCIEAQAPLRPDPRRTTEENVYALTAGIARGFAVVITPHPQQWYPFHPIWPGLTIPPRHK